MMKKKLGLAIILTVVLVLILSVSTAGAATRKLALFRAEMEAGNNAAIFYFRVYGDFPKYEGSVYFGNKVTKLNCNMQKNDNILICRMERGVPGIGGKVVKVVVNGFGFYPYVEVLDACMPYYDWPPNEKDSSGPWVYYGQYCQDEPFKENKVYEINNPFYGPSPYLLGTGAFCGPGGSWNDYGLGLYYVTCASQELN